jgi:copper chaperone NosL
MKRSIYYFSMLLIMIACKPSPEPIRYGSDKCDYCSMTIIDNRFGGEAVTDKGKVYKFDATECMIMFSDSWPDSMDNIAFLLSNSIDKPGQFTDARNCFYLRSPNMPSPMGMNINPFADSLTALDQQTRNTGQILRFGELKGLIYAP